MLKEEFLLLLTHFAQRPVPALHGRHVYLWHGEPAELQAALSSQSAVELDLHTLVTELARQPTAQAEARRVLQAAIATKLRTLTAANQQQQVIVIRGGGLLARYRAPLDLFFQTAGDACLIVFVIPPAETTFQPARPLPGYVRLAAAATLVYLAAQVGEQAVIGAALS
jgi:hypothetical protein